MTLEILDRRRRRRAAVRQRRQGARDSRRRERAVLLDPSVADSVAARRPAPVRVGPALSAARRVDAGLSDQRNTRRHRAGAEGTVGRAGHLHGEADREGQGVHAAARRDDGSARQERGGGAATAVRRCRSASTTRSNTIQDTLPQVQQARERAQAAGNTDLAQQLQTLAGATGGRGVAAVARWPRTRRRCGRSVTGQRRRPVVRSVRFDAGRQRHAAVADRRRGEAALKRVRGADGAGSVVGRAEPAVVTAASSRIARAAGAIAGHTSYTSPLPPQRFRRHSPARARQPAVARRARLAIGRAAPPNPNLQGARPRRLVRDAPGGAVLILSHWRTRMRALLMLLAIVAMAAPPAAAQQKPRRPRRSRPRRPRPRRPASAPVNLNTATAGAARVAARRRRQGGRADPRVPRRRTATSRRSRT